MKKFVVLLFSVIFLFFTGSAIADSIDPLSFSDTLAVGESVTVRKTVTIDDAPPTSGVLDVMFLIDTSGSMSEEIDLAKAAAGEILTGLSGFGDLAAGVGYYDEPGPGPGYPPAIISDLSTTATPTIFDGVTWLMGGGGGDFPEEGIRSVTEVADGASWRPGSSRFIIALGDAAFKESDGFTLAGAVSSMDAIDATFIGIDYGFDSFGTWIGMTSGPEAYGDPDNIPATELSDPTGGSIITASGLDTDALVADIIAGVTASFAEYDEVTVSDLGAGMPGVGVSVAAVSGEGAIVGGDTFVGDFDRSETRTFEFDVTFTGLAEGTHDFTTLALVDGGAVARETDSITVGGGAPVPEPATMMLFGLGLLGLAGVTRRK